MPNPSDPRDHNRYTYVRNNPLKYTDPSGHCGETDKWGLSLFEQTFCSRIFTSSAIDQAVLKGKIEKELSPSDTSTSFGRAIDATVNAIATYVTSDSFGENMSRGLASDSGMPPTEGISTFGGCGGGSIGGGGGHSSVTGCGTISSNGDLAIVTTGAAGVGVGTGADAGGGVMFSNAESADELSGESSGFNFSAWFVSASFSWSDSGIVAATVLYGTSGPPRVWYSANYTSVVAQWNFIGSRITEESY